MKLFIDDTRPVPFGFILAKSVEEAISLCEQQRFDQISLDFNLGFKKKSGLDFMREFIERGLYVTHINIHSNDTIGVRKIIEEINQSIIEGKLNKEIMITKFSYLKDTFFSVLSDCPPNARFFIALPACVAHYRLGNSAPHPALRLAPSA